MPPLPFVIADVFTDRAFSGNQLAVIPDARGLSAELMQKIAREFNFSETTFVLPADAERARPFIHIFTPHEELPFAGHPTIGTAAVLSLLQRAPPAAAGWVTYDERIGPITCRVQPPEGRRLSAEFEIATALKHAASPEIRHVAPALGLPEAAVLQAWSAGIGIPFCFVQLLDRQAVDATVIDSRICQLHLAHCPQQFFVFAGDYADGGTLYARMLAPAMGIAEDPATGSACVALVASLAERSGQPECTLTIHQGIAMGRASVLHARTLRGDGDGDAAARVRVGGSSVIIAEGSLHV
jgi:trans-2,3-dihydro-3-hydroxyanthranilate isomerase